MANQKNLLTDLEVLTVGLVPKGAVSLYEDEETGEPTGINFFLMKSMEAGMNEDQDVVIEEVETPDAETPEAETPESQPETPQAPTETAEKSEPDAESLLSKVRAILGIGKAEKAKDGKVSKPDMAKLKAAVAMLRAGGYNVTERQIMSLMSGDDDEMEKARDKTKKANDDAPVETSEDTPMENNTATVAAEKAHIEAVVRAMQSQFDTQLERQTEAIAKALEEKYEGKINDLLDRLEKSDAEKADAVAKREKREVLEKALTFYTIPVQKDQLGERLYELKAKAGDEAFEWWEAALKAVDNRLTAADVFAEYGTSRSIEEMSLVQKAEKIAKEENISYADALLKLPEHEQQALLKEMRGA